MNKNEYKQVMSGVRPSQEFVEKIMDIPDGKKYNDKILIKRLTSAALAFVVLVTGSFCLSGILNNGNKETPIKVLAAYGNEFFSVESGTKQTLMKGIYIAPIDDEEKIEEERAKAQNDYEEIVSEVESFSDEEHASWQGVGRYDLYNQNTDKITAVMFTSGAGYFVANKENYDNVKSFTVENISEYGILQFEYNKTYDLILSQTEDEVDPDNTYSLFRNHKFTITGDELRESQKEFNGNYGYTVLWDVSPYFEKVAGENGGFDISSIKDEIVFTFEYEDGTMESASVDITFDSYGHMQISKQCHFS